MEAGIWPSRSLLRTTGTSSKSTLALDPAALLGQPRRFRPYAVACTTQRGGFGKDLYRDAPLTSPSGYFFDFLLEEGHRPIAFDVFFTPFQLIVHAWPRETTSHRRAASPQKKMKMWTSDACGKVCKLGWSLGGASRTPETLNKDCQDETATRRTKIEIKARGIPRIRWRVGGQRNVVFGGGCVAPGAFSGRL